MRHLRLLVSLLVAAVVSGLVSLGAASPAAAAEQSLGHTYSEEGWIASAFTADLDVAVTDGIDVAAVGVNAYYEAPVELAVYSRPGSSAGHESTDDGWTLLGTPRVDGAGKGQVTRVPLSFHLPHGLSGLRVVVLNYAGYENFLIGYNGGAVSNDDLTLTPRSVTFDDGVHGDRRADTTVFYEPTVPADTTAPDTTVATGPSVPPATTTRPSPTPAPPATPTTSSATSVRPSRAAAPGTRPAPTTASPFVDLADGDYTFSVRAVDATGNADTTPATREFQVNTASPTITATVSSAKPASAYGWYRAPVSIRYACDAAGSALAAPCPGRDMLRDSGADQVVTRSVSTSDGDTAQVVTEVSIDRVLPRVRVAGFNPARTYTRRPAIDCVATDAHSGVRVCRAYLGVNKARTRINVFARSVDNAGNVRVVRLSARWGGR